MGTSFKDKNDVNQEALIDFVTDGVITVPQPHHQMHAGNHYFIKTWLINTGDTGTFDEFIFITPDTTKRIHAMVSIFADADATFEIFEGATIEEDGEGTPIAGINNDRDSSNTSELLPYASPTIATDGTLIWSARNGGGKVAIGVGLTSNYEIIAKTNSIYLFRLTKNTSDNTVIDVDFFWYEHIPKSN